MSLYCNNGREGYLSELPIFICDYILTCYTHSLFILIFTGMIASTIAYYEARIESNLLIAVSIFSQSRDFNPISHLVHFSVEKS